MRGQDPCPAAERSLLRFPSLLRVSALCPEPSAGFPRGPEHNPPSCVPCPRAVTPPPHDGPSSLLSAPGTEEPLAWLALCSRVFPHRLLQDSAVQARVPGPSPARVPGPLQQPSQPSSLTPASRTSAQRDPPALKARLVASRSHCGNAVNSHTHTARSSRRAGDTREGRAERPLVLT